MIVIFEARPVHLPEVEALYRDEGYLGGVSPSDLVLVAHDSDHVVGVVRLCREHGTLVLRGMYVRSEMQRNGVGSKLLHSLDNRMRSEVCFCVAGRHLLKFYGQLGFVETPNSEAPQFLRDRLVEYTRQGYEVVILRRAAESDTGPS